MTVCCSVLQCVDSVFTVGLQCVAVCYSVLQCVRRQGPTAFCSVLQFAAACLQCVYRVLQYVEEQWSTAVCSVLQCVAVCCSLLHCVYSVFTLCSQCVAVCRRIGAYSSLQCLLRVAMHCSLI